MDFKLVRQKGQNCWVSSVKELSHMSTWLFCLFFLISYYVVERYFVFRIDLTRPFELFAQFTSGWEELADLGFKMQNYSKCVFSVSIVMLQMAAIYYGPVVGGVVGAVGALISLHLVGEQPIAPIYVIQLVISQIICALIIYKKKATFARMVMVNFIITFYINIPYQVLAMFVAKTDYIWMNIVIEVFEQMVQLPIICVLLYMRVATTSLLNLHFAEIRAGAEKMLQAAKRAIVHFPSTMKRFFVDLGISFRDSAKELRKTSTLVVCALMLALGTVLGMMFSFKIDDSHVVGISVIAPQLVSALYGPFVGGLVGAAGDILDCIINPKGPFFPGYTLNAMLGQIIYGVILYKKQWKLSRIFVSKIFVALLVNLPLGTLWSMMFVNKAYVVILTGKIVQQAIQIPVLGILFYMFVSALRNAKILQKIQNK